MKNYIKIGIGLVLGTAAYGTFTFPVIPSESIFCPVAGNETEFSTSDGYLQFNQYAITDNGNYIWINRGDGTKKEIFQRPAGMQEVQIIKMRYWQECDNKGIKEKYNDLTQKEYEDFELNAPMIRNKNKTLIELLTPKTFAAIAHSATASGRNSTGNSITIALTCTAGDYVIVGTSVQDSNHANYPVTNITHGGSGLTKIRSDEAAGNNRTELWYEANSSICNGSPNNVVVSVTGALGELAAGIDTFSGVKTSSPNDGNNGQTGNGFAGTLTTTSTTDGMCEDVFSTEATITGTGSGQTRAWGPLTDQSYENSAGAYKPSSGASTGMSENMGSGQSYAQSAVCFAVASGSISPSNVSDIIFFE